MKKCSFFGHRNTRTTSKLEQKLTDVIEDLIVNKDFSVFLFGSNSTFNTLCHMVVTKLKEKYPHIKRISYTCKSESFFYEYEKEKWQELYKKFKIDSNYIAYFEEGYEHKTKYTAGKASYIERNQAMIDDSDLCIFYYDKAYQPKPQKTSKKGFIYIQPQSGAKLAYDYAVKKKKNIINLKNSV